MKTEAPAALPVPNVEDAGTRRRVLATVMERGATTAGELATSLQITPAAVRRHLTALTDDGLIMVRERRPVGSRGRGRPAKVYIATDAGRSAFEQAYDLLAIEALDFIADRLGPEGVAEFARTRFAEVTRRYADRVQAAGEPVAGLAAALSDDGFMATVQPVSSGQQLCQHHCPVAHVAERYPVLCVAETEAISDVLGSHVQRLATIAHGDGVCTTHVPRPVLKGTRP